jgi:hypothetical protein
MDYFSTFLNYLRTKFNAFVAYLIANTRPVANTPPEPPIKPVEPPKPIDPIPTPIPTPIPPGPPVYVPPAPVPPGQEEGVPAVDVNTFFKYGNLAYPGLPFGAGGPGPMGSFPVPVPDTMNGQIVQAWLIVLSDIKAFTTRSVHFVMPKGHMLSIKFRTPSEPWVGGLAKADTSIGGVPTPMFLTCSRTRGDFDYAKNDAANPAYKGYSSGDVGVSVTTNPTELVGAATLSPDTDYFFNLRWEMAGSALYGTTTANRGVEACTGSAGGAVLRFS